MACIYKKNSGLSARGNAQNRFRKGDLELLKNTRYLFGRLISLKKTELFGVELCGLKRSQVMPYPRPWLSARMLGDTFYQQSKHTDFNMGLNPMR